MVSRVKKVQSQLHWLSQLLKHKQGDVYREPDDKIVKCIFHVINLHCLYVRCSRTPKMSKYWNEKKTAKRLSSQMFDWRWNLISKFRWFGRIIFIHTDLTIYKNIIKCRHHCQLIQRWIIICRSREDINLTWIYWSQICAHWVIYLENLKKEMSTS